LFIARERVTGDGPAGSPSERKVQPCKEEKFEERKN